MGDQSTGPSFKHMCAVENASKFLDWIKNRGGVAVWHSADLSDPGFSLSTPATTDGEPTKKPHWKVGPVVVYTDPAEIGVYIPKEVKRFRVGIRRGRAGLSFKVTDAGSRKIRAAVAQAGEGAFYEFDYMTQEAVILVPDKQVSLLEWGKEHGQGR